VLEKEAIEGGGVVSFLIILKVRKFEIAILYDFLEIAQLKIKIAGSFYP
jgi:hypothetical protein